jgi:hypothetical protein
LMQNARRRSSRSATRLSTFRRRSSLWQRYKGAAAQIHRVRCSGESLEAQDSVLAADEITGLLKGIGKLHKIIVFDSLHVNSNPVKEATLANGKNDGEAQGSRHCQDEGAIGTDS